MTEHDYDNGYRAGMHDMRGIAQARIDKLEQGLRDIKFYSDEEYAIGRATAALEEVPEPVRIQRVHDLDRNGEFMGHHIITCNPDGTDATVTWEPIGGEY
tara:strand:+ start:12 stop:311 length:300 start_codon:yes stop_codon:yes gene_type:complete